MNMGIGPYMEQSSAFGAGGVGGGKGKWKSGAVGTPAAPPRLCSSARAPDEGPRGSEWGQREPDLRESGNQL